jgi:hypothetical protein
VPASNNNREMQNYAEQTLLSIDLRTYIFLLGGYYSKVYSSKRAIKIFFKNPNLARILSYIFLEIISFLSRFT